MMTRKTSSKLLDFRLVLVLSLVMLLTPIQPTSADQTTEQAEAIVLSLAEEIWSNIGPTKAEGRQRRLAEVIKARTDIDVLSRLALGKYWRQLDSAQQDDYQSLFSVVIMNTLAGRLDTFLGELSGPLDNHFRISNSMRVGKRDVLVRSKVIAVGDVPLSVDWRLRRGGEDPVIIDLVIEGVSLLVSQRAEFTSVIEKGQVEGLLQALEQRVPAS